MGFDSLLFKASEGSGYKIKQYRWDYKDYTKWQKVPEREQIKVFLRSYYSKPYTKEKIKAARELLWAEKEHECALYYM